MELIYKRCCGLDVHKRIITACIRLLLENGSIHQETRTFGTMTRDLLELADWLATEGVTHVALESTGSYWKPVYNILEGRFKLVLVNARHIKHVPGRKTDVKDCQWLAQLLQAGLLKGSFIPERPQRELRDLTRHRSQLVGEKNRAANRIQKILEDANIKLASVATDILGASGRDMLRALMRGETDAEQMADLARRQLRSKIPELRRALEGKVTEHHRFMLAELLNHLEYLESRIEEFSRRIEEVSRPFAPAIAKVATLPASGVVDGGVPRQQRKRRQTQERQDHQRQSLAAFGPVSIGLGRHPQERLLLPGPIPPPGRSPGQEALYSGRGPFAADDHLPYAKACL
jgi:transposase